MDIQQVYVATAKVIKYHCIINGYESLFKGVVDNEGADTSRIDVLNLEDDLLMDDMDVIELLMAVEDELGCEVDDDGLTEEFTVKQFVEFFAAGAI